MRNRTFAAVVLFAVVLSPAFAQETVRVRCTEGDARREIVPIFIVTGDAVPADWDLLSDSAMFVLDGYDVDGTVIYFTGHYDDGVRPGAYVEANGLRNRPRRAQVKVSHPFSPNGAFTVWVGCAGRQGFVLVDPPDFVDVVDVGEPLPLGESTGGRP